MGARGRQDGGIGKLSAEQAKMILTKEKPDKDYAAEFGLSVHTIREYRRRLQGKRSDRTVEYNKKRWKTVGVTFPREVNGKQVVRQTFDLEDTEEL